MNAGTRRWSWTCFEPSLCRHRAPAPARRPSGCGGWSDALRHELSTIGVTVVPWDDEYALGLLDRVAVRLHPQLAGGAMKPLVAGVVAAVPGAAAVALAGVNTPADARLWTWVAAVGVVLAVHPALRWASTVALVGIVVAVVLTAGVTGLP